MKLRSICRSTLQLRIMSICFVLVMVYVPIGQSQVLEEVVVTATKRTESLQDVGISVAAFSGNDLERMGLSNSEEVLLKVPNLEIQSNAGSTNANIFLRGIGTTGISFNVQSGVGIYSDEVVLNSPVVNILQMYDLERVEVLRGPQNTLYGRNTTGGAVNFISRKAEVGEQANGYGNLTYGRFNEVDIEGAVGVPLGDKAAIRVAAQGQFRDGFRKNLISGRDDVGREKYAFRSQLLFEPSDTMSINLKGHIERVRSDNIRFKTVAGLDPDDLTQPCATPFVLGACANGNGFVDSANPREHSSDLTNPQNDVNAGGFSANIQMDFDNFTLTSITAYEENSQKLSEDSDASPAHAFHFFIASKQDQISQEIRIASNEDQDFRWIVGGYGFWESKTGTTGPTFGTPMGVMLVRSKASYDNTTYSGYVDLERDLNEKFTVKGGFRYSSDNIEGSATAILAFESQLGGLDISGPSLSGAPLPDFDDLLAAAIANGGTVVNVGGPTDPNSPINDTTFNEWGSKAGLDFHPTDDVLIYAQWSRGFKSGLFVNAPMAIVTGQGGVAIKPEIVNTYEIGAKTEFGDGRARLNAAVFFNDYKDQQINQFIVGEFRAVNADSEILGAEDELNCLPLENTYVNVSLGYLDTKIVKPPENDLAQKGNKLPNAPEFSSQIGLRKEWILNNGSLFGIGGDGRYSSKRYFDLQNLTNDNEYFVINAQAYYEFGADSQYRISVWGKNITDQLYFNNSFTELTPSGNVVYPSEPATYGITFKASF